MHVFPDDAKVLPASILIVDDHRDTLVATGRLLEQSGYQTVGARTCAEALAAAERQRFDLVLCELGLADGDGCELFCQLRERYGLRGIAYTADGMPVDVGDARAAGLDAHLLKPVRWPDLLAAIQAALARRSADEKPEPP